MLGGPNMLGNRQAAKAWDRLRGVSNKNNYKYRKDRGAMIFILLGLAIIGYLIWEMFQTVAKVL